MTKKVKLMIGVLVALILVAIWVFEFGLDTDAGCTVSGFDALGQLSTEFWGWLIGLWTIAVFAVFKFVKWGKEQVWFGKSNLMIFAIALLFIIPTLQAYDVKANCGTTGTKGNPANQHPKDDGRIPAEDLLPK